MCGWSNSFFFLERDFSRDMKYLLFSNLRDEFESQHILKKRKIYIYIISFWIERKLNQSFILFYWNFSRTKSSSWRCIDERCKYNRIAKVHRA